MKLSELEEDWQDIIQLRLAGLMWTEYLSACRSTRRVSISLRISFFYSYGTVHSIHETRVTEPH